VQSKKASKTEREEKRRCKGGKKGSGKKLLLNAAEIEERLVQLLYSGIQKNIEINREIVCLLTEK